MIATVLYVPRESGWRCCESTCKTEQGQYPAILTEQAWSIKALLYGKRTLFSCGTQRVIPSGQDSPILLSRSQPYNKNLSALLWVFLLSSDRVVLLSFLFRAVMLMMAISSSSTASLNISSVESKLIRYR